MGLGHQAPPNIIRYFVYTQYTSVLLHLWLSSSLQTDTTSTITALHREGLHSEQIRVQNRVLEKPGWPTSLVPLV